MRNLAVARPGGLGGANRSFDSLATTAPQANADFYGVGINGATSPENLYLIDGIAVNNPGFGTLGTPLTAEFMDEINIVTGGYMPEYGRNSGGVISGVTKSGGNEFHGSCVRHLHPRVAGRDAGDGGRDDFHRPGEAARWGTSGDIGATLGGYLIKDRLWFFAGIQWSAQRYIYSRSFNRLFKDPKDPEAIPKTEAIPNSTQRWNGDERSINYIGKLTYLISSDHRVSLTVTGTPTTGGGEGGVALRNRSSNRVPYGPRLLTLGTFNSAIHPLQVRCPRRRRAAEQRVPREAVAPGRAAGSALPAGLVPAGRRKRAGRHRQAQRPRGRPPGPLTGATFPLPSTSWTPPCRARSGRPVPSPEHLATCSASLLEGRVQLETLDFDSYQARAVLTYLVTAAGHHVLKAGFDGQINKYNHDQSCTGGAVVWRRAGPRRRRPERSYDAFRFGHLSGTDVIVDTPRVQTSTQSTILGGFIQDSWSVLDKVTLNLGVRYDTLTMQGQDGKTRISLEDQLSPRVGLVWDPTQQGRSKLFVNYGRYYEYIPLDIADRSLSSSQASISGLHQCNPLQVGRTGCDANTRTDGQSFITGVTQAPNRKWATGGAPYAVLRGPRPQVAGQRRDRRRRRVRGPAQRTRSA